MLKQDLIDLEFDIISKLQFSLQSASPMTFAERYLKVLGIEEIEVNKLCNKLFKLTVLNCTLSL